MKPVLIALVVAWLALAAIAYLLSDRLIFLPPPSSYGPGDVPVTMIPADDGVAIAVLHLPNDSARYTVLHGHGNAEDIGQLAPSLARMRDRVGVSVLAYDYRGYGMSTGGPASVRAASADAAAALRYATEELGIPPERIILHGRSLGSGPAVELAAEHDVAGLVIESGFVSAFRVMTRVPLLPFDRFPNLARMPDVDAPVLVIHGVRDAVIPAWHGRRLYAAAGGPKQALWVEEAGHNDLEYVAGERYWAAMREFVETVERESLRSHPRASGDPRPGAQHPPP